MSCINIDDLLQVIFLEQRAYISPDPKTQQRYINRVLDEIERDPILHGTMTSEYKEREIKLVHEFVEMYNQYRALLGDFKPLYGIAYDYYNSTYDNPTEMEEIILINDTTMKIVKYIVGVVDQPIILDPPGSFGWDMTKNNIGMFSKMKLRRCPQSIIVSDLQRDMEQFLDKTNVVALCPGMDYKDRNVARDNSINNFLLDNLDNFYTSADVMISTNGLFNTPKHEYLQQRTWFDAREVKAKEELMNRGTIDNMCDEIVTRMDELRVCKEN